MYKFLFLLVLLVSCKTQSNLVNVPAEVAFVPQHELTSIPGTTIEFSMTLVPSGKTTIGNEVHSSEGPAFEANVQSFWIGTHELTFDEYKVFRKKDLDLVPIALPLAFGLNIPPALALAAVMGGGVFGDHCSPISDTSIIASFASGCDHISHVRTQLPYALTGAGVATALYIGVGFFMV